QDSPPLAECRLQRGDVHEHVSAPDDVSDAVLERQGLRAPPSEADELTQLRSACRRGGEPRVRELEVTCDRIDPVHRESEALRERDRMAPFATADVDDGRLRPELKVPHELVEQLWSTWAQALIEGGLKLGLDTRKGVVRLLEGEAR